MKATTLLCLLLLCLNCYPQGSHVTTNDEIVKWTTEYMANALKFDHFSGAVLIARDGKPIFRKAFGMANYEMDVANAPETKFRIGSVSKQFTAAAILLLQDQGKLKVDDPICRYLDDCPDAWRPITIKQLLNHTSGIVNFTRLPAASGNFLLTPHSTKEVVDTFRALPLDSKPGEQYNYNNSGYYLLGMIIERVSNTTYADFIRKNLFASLEMGSTDSDVSSTIVRNRASSYYLGSDSVFRNSGYTNMEILFSMGGAYSTVDDLLRWEQGISTGKLLRPSTVEQMYTPGKGNYGYGWWIDRLGSCDRTYHDGGVTNFSSSLQRLPGERLTIIAISNRGDDGGLRVAYDVAGKICGIPATIRAIQPELETLDAEKLTELVTRARAGFPNFDIRERKVEEIGNYLMLIKQTKQAIEVFKLNISLYPKSANAYLKLGIAYRSIGDKALAIKSLRQCLDIDPQNKTAADLIKELS